MKQKSHYKNNLYFTVIHFRGSFMCNGSRTISHDYPPWNSIPSHAWGHLRYSTPSIKTQGAAFWYFPCLRKSLLSCYKMFPLSLQDCNIHLWDQYADSMQYSAQTHISFWDQIQKILFSPTHVQLTTALQQKRENNKNKPKNHTPLFWMYLFPPPAQHRAKKQLYRHKPWSERKQMGTVTTKSQYCHQLKKLPAGNKWKEIR